MNGEGVAGGCGGNGECAKVVVGGKKTRSSTQRMVGPESRSDRRTSSSLRSTVSDAGRGSNEDVILSKYITRIMIDLILKVWKSDEPGKMLKSSSGSRMRKGSVTACRSDVLAY